MWEAVVGFVPWEDCVWVNAAILRRWNRSFFKAQNWSSREPHKLNGTQETSIQCSMTSYSLLAGEGCSLCPLIPPKRFQQRQHIRQDKVSGRPGQRHGQI